MHGHRRIHRHQRPRARSRTVKFHSAAEAIAVDASGNVLIADTQQQPNPSHHGLGSEDHHDRGRRHRRHRHRLGDGANGEDEQAVGNRRGIRREHPTSATGFNDRLRKLVCNATPCLTTSTWTLSTPAGSTGTLLNPEQMAIGASDVLVRRRPLTPQDPKGHRLRHDVQRYARGVAPGTGTHRLPPSTVGQANVVRSRVAPRRRRGPRAAMCTSPTRSTNTSARSRSPPV